MFGPCVLHLKRLLALVLLGAAATGARGSEVAEAAPAVHLPAGNWIVMGSSSAAGTGVPRGKGWVALLAAAYEARGARLVNLARPGAVTYSGLSTHALPGGRRPRPDRKANIDAALALDPVLLILSYPTNDTAFGYSVDETVNNLLAMRAQAQAAGVPVIVMSTQPRGLDDMKLADLRAIDDRLAARVGPCFVEVRQALAGEDGRLAPRYDAGDGIHPGKSGHAVIAAHLMDVINSGRCIRVVR